MAHSKEVLTVTRWQAADNTTFETQAEAEAYESILNRKAANGKAEREITDFIQKQVNEIKNYESEIASLESQLQKITSSIRTYNLLIINDRAELTRLQSIPKKKLTKREEDRIEKLTETIKSNQKQLDTLKDESVTVSENLEASNEKLNIFMESVFPPFLEVWGDYRSDQLFLNEYEALKSLVIENTSTFLSMVSQIGSSIGLGALKLSKENWWGDDGRFDEGPKRAIEMVPRA